MASDSIPVNAFTDFIIGTLVARRYINCLGGNKRAEKVIQICYPSKNESKVPVSLLVDPETMPCGLKKL